ncbi:MAG: GTP-binding protein [Euryarchaeota archaeon]|nr:GTP-binding protein [Euryarchaeota archaeon]
MNAPKIWKICVIGDRAVGKTSLIKRYVFNSFTEEMDETVESKAYRKKVDNTLLMIWDVSVYEQHVDRVLSGAKAIIIVGDITRGETYETMGKIGEFLDGHRAMKIFVGNKGDLKYRAEFWKDEMQELAGAFDSQYIFTSAKTGENVESLFNMIIESM